MEKLNDWLAESKDGELTRKQLDALKDMVSDLQAQGVKGLSLGEFKEFFHNHASIASLSGDAVVLDDRFIDAIFQAMDLDGDSTLDPTELDLAIEVFSAKDCNTAIARLFQGNSSGKGTLERADIESMMRKNLKTASEKDPLSEESIAQLKVKFAELAPEGKMDEKGLAKALGFKGGDESVKSIFNAFDTDGSGKIEWEEFLVAVQSINDKETATDQRILIAFAKEDSDESGFIDKEEIKRVLQNETAGGIELSEEQFQKYVDDFMRLADRDGDGHIHFEEFAAVLRRNPEGAKAVGLGEGHVMQLASGRRPRGGPHPDDSLSCCGDFCNMFVGWTKWHWAIMIIYLGAVTYMVIEKCTAYDSNSVVLDLLDPVAVCLARGSAGAIMFSAIWVLLPMCRTFMTFLRNNGPRSFPWDDSIDFHKFVALFILINTIIHCVGHCHNYYRVVVSSWALVNPVLGPAGSGAFDTPPEEDGGDNCDSHCVNVWLALIGGPSWTGVAMLVIFCISYPCCSEWFRSVVLAARNKLCGCCVTPDPKESTFNLFWYTHHLFLGFLILLCIHGAWQWLAVPTAYKYVIPCLTIYAIEKTLRGRLMRWKDRDESIGEWIHSVFTLRPRPVILAKQHKKSRALEFHVQKPDQLRYVAGQYCFINVPAIGQFEWHPFTLTSAPHENCLKFHIAAVGDWTKKLYDLFPNGWEDQEAGSNGKKDRNNLMAALADQLEKAPNHEARLHMETLQDSLIRHSLKVYVDGPYGAPAQDFTKYEVSILIGAGIGVTPFAAVLRDLLHKYSAWRDIRDPLEGLREMTRGAAAFPTDFQLKKVYFHWSTRTQQSLSWFTKIMNDISERDEENFLEMHNWLTTGKVSKSGGIFNAARSHLASSSGKDALTGLDSGHVTTHLGERPNYDQIFDEVKEKHPSAKVGVFFCGPKVIRAILDKACREKSGRRDAGETRFKLHAENF